MPCWLIHGARDQSSTLEGPRALHAAWPGSELVVVDAERRDFTINALSADPLTGELKRAEDALGRWLDERCVRITTANSLTAELFNDWKQWAEASGEFVGAQRRFSDLLITRGLDKWRNGMGVRGFQGIGLKQPHTPAYTPYSDD